MSMEICHCQVNLSSTEWSIPGGDRISHHRGDSTLHHTGVHYTLHHGSHFVDPLPGVLGAQHCTFHIEREYGGSCTEETRQACV